MEIKDRICNAVSSTVMFDLHIKAYNIKKECDNKIRNYVRRRVTSVLSHRVIREIVNTRWYIE